MNPKDNLKSASGLEYKQAKKIADTIGLAFLDLSPKLLYVIEETFGWVFFYTHRIYYRYSQEYPTNGNVVVVVDAIEGKAWNLLPPYHGTSYIDAIRFYYIENKKYYKRDEVYDVNEYDKVDVIFEKLRQYKKLNCIQGAFFRLERFYEYIFRILG